MITYLNAHMQVCLDDMYNFIQFTILSLSYFWIILLTLNI